MNINDFRGFKQVFLFELMTGIKKPAFKWFLITICCIAFFTTPLMLIIGNSVGDDSDSEGAPKKSVIETVYVYNETGLSIDHSNLNSSEKYAEVSFITDNSKSYDDAVESLKGSRNKELVLKAEYDEKKGFEIAVVNSGKSGIKSDALKSFEEDYTEFFREETLKNLDVSSDDYDYMSKDINIAIMEADKDGSFKADEGSISASDYSLLLGGLMILFFFINMSAGNVSTSIATEKSSRVIEYLLTGTRPLALLSGKIAARLIESVITTVASFSSYYMSQVVCLFFTVDRNAVAASTSDNVVMVSSVWETITLSKLAIAAVYFLIGLGLFSILGALAGASVSKLDELQDAYKLFAFIMILSVYSDMFLIIMMLNGGVSDAVRGFFTMCPFTGAFLTPALIVTGKLSVLSGIIALIIMIIFTALVFVLAAAVYESMLLFQGKRLQIKDIIALMKKQVVE